MSDPAAHGADATQSTSGSTAPAIRLTDLRRAFGNVTAVDGVTLDIPAGEFFSMLGPSGSGKTTVLRLIAGFDTPTAGSIELFGKPVQKLAPYDRDVNTVFQDYALFPHLSVRENVEFGLRIRRLARAERRQRALAALERMQLAHLADRKPWELSGGQRQRVALARAIVVDPKVLLLDEPLGALDLKLREQMQVELKQLQRDLGITFIFVTHDQEEALTLSDRVAVFNDGSIQQVDSPQALYDHPRTEFVATFVGTSNVFAPEQAQRYLAHEGTVSVRPEKIRILEPDTTASPGLVGTIEERIFVGSGTRTLVRLADELQLEILEPAGSPERRRGDRVGLAISETDVHSLAASPPKPEEPKATAATNQEEK